MAKPNPSKNPKSDSPAEMALSDASKSPDASKSLESGKVSTESAATASSHAIESATKPVANPPASNLGKKDAVVNRNKKGPASSTKGSSLMPSQHKLENLKAAVAAAGSVDNLLLILQHVDEAGGRQEVAESVEAYRALKLALE